MGKSNIHPYFYPTTALFIDDDPAFLESMSLYLDEEAGFRLYRSPNKALQFIEKQQRVTRPYQRCFSRCLDKNGTPMSGCTVNLEVGEFAKEVYNPARFEEVSVIVVDYELPGMDGLEICRRLKNTPIKKMLLTGVADERDALDAFNEGIIDHFVMKSEDDVLKHLDESIFALQQRYFQDVTESILPAVDVSFSNFLHDPRFAELFAEVRDTYKIKEYYLLDEPSGFLMVNGDGQVYLMILPTEEQWASHLEIARDENAPAELIEKITNREIIPYFWKTGGYYRADTENWDEYAYPSEKFEGTRLYHYAVVKDPAFLGFDKAHISGYNAYLDAIDELEEYSRSVRLNYLDRRRPQHRPE